MHQWEAIVVTRNTIETAARSVCSCVWHSNEYALRKILLTATDVCGSTETCFCCANNAFKPYPKESNNILWISFVVTMLKSSTQRRWKNPKPLADFTYSREQKRAKLKSTEQTNEKKRCVQKRKNWLSFFLNYSESYTVRVNEKKSSIKSNVCGARCFFCSDGTVWNEWQR